MTVEVLSFGCRLNGAESDAMRRAAEVAGRSDLTIVNTCAVTAEATRQARQAIRRARRERPEATLVVTGCAAQIDPGMFTAMPEVDRVVGNDDKLSAAISAEGPRLAVRAFETGRPAPVEGFAGRARGFVQAQTGCDHRCTFCVIPMGRGPSRSLDIDTVVAGVRRLVEAGTAEVVLTGVDVTAWGADLPDRPTLGGLVRAVLAAVPTLPRLRLSSLDAVEVDEALIAAFAEEPRLMPHLHLSLQSGDDLVLKRMKRRHRAADAARFCERMRRARPDITFGADIIAGFPTETEAMFENTLRSIDECDITFLHGFAFSARQGTPAARMPQVAGPIVKERAERLAEVGRRRLALHLARHVGRRGSVLIESARFGRVPDYSQVSLGRSHPVGQIVDLAFESHDGRRLVESTRPGR